MIASLRIDNLKGASSPDRPNCEVEVREAQSKGLVSSKTQNFDRLANDLVSRDTNCV